MVKPQHSLVLAHRDKYGATYTIERKVGEVNKFEHLQLQITRNHDEAKFANVSDHIANLIQVLRDRSRLGLSVAAYRLVGWPTYHAIIERKPRLKLSNQLAEWANHPEQALELKYRMLIGLYVVAAVCQLHCGKNAGGIVHGDVKAENIFQIVSSSGRYQFPRWVLSVSNHIAKKYSQGFTFAGYEAAVERLSMKVNDDHAIVSTPIMGPVFLPAKTQFANIFKTAPEVKTDIAASRK